MRNRDRLNKTSLSCIFILISLLGLFESAQAQFPAAPINLVATGINTGGMIQFTAPANDGGSSITYYEYSIDNGANWITPSPALTASPLIISSGLTNCTTYSILFRAVNILGSGAASSAVNLVPAPSVIGVSWTTSALADNNFWTSVTYGKGLFVAVAGSGAGNRVMTSPDGITWTARTSAADNSWSSVTYGNGLFVAVANTGMGNRVMTSEDGINWTARASAADLFWSSVTYGNGLFVAVSYTGTVNRVMTSPDGINWTSRASVNNDWWSVTYGNGLFVAVSRSGRGDQVMTSPDGITWTARAVVNNDWLSVTYGNGLFVAVAASGTGNRVMTSPDGITWTARTSVADNRWTSITYSNGLFVAVSTGPINNRVMTSPDGTNWTSRAAVNNDWSSVTFGNGLFVAVSTSGTGNRVMKSSYRIVPDAPVITAATNIGSGILMNFTQSTSLVSPSIDNYEYSIDRGFNWVKMPSIDNVSPTVINNLPMGTSRIMLRGVNSIGKSCPSNIFSLVPGINIMAYPNPAKGDVRLELNGFTAGVAEIRLLDLNGKLLQTQKATLKTGIHSISLPFKTLITGNYIIQVVQYGKYYSTRFTKM